MINLDTLIKPGQEIEIGDEVLDIYTFLSFYTNPYHCKQQFIYTVKGSNNEFFSVFKNEIPTYWSGSESFYYTSKKIERSIQEILNRRENSFNRTTIYLRINQDRNIIEYFINLLFEEENTKINLAENEQIARYEKEIANLKKKIKMIKTSGMINEPTSKIYDKDFLKTQKEKILSSLNDV